MQQAQVAVVVAMPSPRQGSREQVNEYVIATRPVCYREEKPVERKEEKPVTSIEILGAYAYGYI